MTEFKVGNAIVRVHNEPNQEEIKKHTVAFLKKVYQQKKKGSKNHAQNK